VLQKIILVSAAAALAAAGFVGASMAASAGNRGCVPGIQCDPAGGTTSTAPATTTTRTTRPPLGKPTLKLSANAIDFGRLLNVSGSVPARVAGLVVQIFSQTCGFDQPLLIGQTKTRANGSYSFVVQPMRNATFFVRYSNLASDTQALTVRPKIELRRVSGAIFGVDLSAGNGAFFSKSVVLERYDKVRRLWRRLASGRLRSNSEPAAIIAVSSAKIRAAVPSGAKLRASASQATVGQCYRATTSPTITA
jgi:hypothetical protein